MAVVLASTITKATFNLVTSAMLALARHGELGVSSIATTDAEFGSEPLAQAALWTIGRLLNSHDLSTDVAAKCIGVLRKGLQHTSAEKRAAMHAINLVLGGLPELGDDLLDLGRPWTRKPLSLWFSTCS